MKNLVPLGKKSIICIFAGILLSLNLFSQSEASSDVPKGLPRSGDIIPAFSVPVPKNKTYKSYLMLKKSGSFQPAEMDVEMLVIEVLNIY